MENDISRCLLLSFFLCLFFKAGICQFDQSISANHPPTPTAASLAKYGEIPISYFNGTANISIPLETIKDGNISLPLSLNYHSSGLKVAETASWVGLGWSLQSGGVISRTIRGLPDERASDNQIIGFLDGPLDVANYQTTQILNVDSESDLYYYNLGGYSGSFTFYYDTNDELQVLLTDYSEIDIEPILTNTSYNKIIWKITLPNGIRYFLGDTADNTDHLDDAVSYSKYYLHGTTSTVADKPTVDSWYVVRIEDLLSGGFLDFDYEWEAYQFRTHGSSRYFIDEEGRNIFTTESLKRYNQTTDHIVTMSLSPRLTSITCRQYTYEFIPGATRKDLDPTKQNTIHPMYVTNIHTLGTIGSPKVLDRIEKRQINGTCLKKYTLSTDYFTSGLTGYSGSETILYNVSYNSSTYKPDRLRLRLTDVTEESCINTDKKTHSIEYTSDDVIRRLSLSSDHWGYHNGKTNNVDPAPKLLIHNSPNDEPLIDLTHISWLSDKSSNEVAMKDGIISKITYPTGGSTSFDFEANDYNSTFLQNTLNVEAEDKTCSGPFAYPCNEDEIITPATNIPNTSNTNDSYEIVLNARKVSQETSQNTITIQVFYKNSVLTNWQFFDEVVLKTTNNFEEYKCYMGSGFIGTNVQFRATNLSNPTSHTFIQLQVLKSSSVVVNDDVDVGGLRLKSLYHDPLEGPTINENFYYTSSKDNDISSGKIYGLPTYILDMRNRPNARIRAGENICLNTPFQLFSGSQVAPASTQGSHIGYKTVFHELGDGSEGYTEYSFEEDMGFDPEFILDYPAPPEQYFDRLAGKPEHIYHHRKNDNGTYSTINLQIFNYQKIEIAEGIGHRFNSYWTCDVETNGVDLEFEEFEIGVYFTNSWVYQNLSTTIILDGVSNFISYSYNSTYQTLVETEEHTNSDNKTFQTKYYYPDSYPSTPTNLATNLNAKKLLSPWKIEKHYTDPINANKSGLVGGSSTMWSYYNSNGGLTTTESDYCYPYRIRSYENTWATPFSGQVLGNLGTADDDIQMTFEEYDLNAGKPTMIKREHWDFDDIYTYDSEGKILTWAFNNYTKSWNWHPGTNLLKNSINIDGTSESYQWDGLMRLQKITDDQRLSSLQYTYSYDQTDINNNYHKVSNYFPKLGSMTQTLDDYTFIDGLSRPYQIKKIDQGPTVTESIILSTEYDEYWRVLNQYEPQSIANSTDVPEIIQGDATNFEYEHSPLNRVTKTISPETWMFHTNTYGSNNSGEVSGFASSRLNKTTVTDANLNKVEIFRDKRGREVLRRAFDGTITHDTWTHYDGLDRQALIIPPGATINTNDLLYRWTYYPIGNIASEIVPGKGTIKYQYDQRDLMTGYQDGNMRNDTKWYTYQLDSYGRSAKEGFDTNPIPSNSSLTIDEILIENTYGTSSQNRIIRDKLISQSCKLLDSSPDYNKEFSYDNVGRLFKQEFEHPLAVVNKPHTEISTFDSADNELTKICEYNVPNAEVKLVHKNEYDHVGRLHQEYLNVNNTYDQILSEYTYTEKNQIKILVIGDGLQEQNFDYLPNRMLKKINDPFSSTDPNLFRMCLHYDDVPGTANTSPRYNGDISAIRWVDPTDLELNNVQTVGFSYDGLNRIRKQKLSNYNATFEYEDLRGNISKLERYQNGVKIDDMDYSYINNSNQISSINDSGNEVGYIKNSGSYLYDDNGNMTTDPSRDITTVYNHLNLPDAITKTTNDKVEYDLDATGSLLRKVTNIPGENQEIRDYIGPTEFVNGQLRLIKHSQGYVLMEESTINNCEVSPDVTSIVTALPTVITGVSDIGIAVEVTEIHNVNTDGSDISVRIPFDERLTFSYDSLLSTVAFKSLNNNDWIYEGNNGVFHTFTFEGVLEAGNTTTFGFMSTYDPQGTSGETTLTAGVVPTSGGECNFSNNADAEMIVYFVVGNTNSFTSDGSTNKRKRLDNGAKISATQTGKNGKVVKNIAKSLEANNKSTNLANNSNPSCLKYFWTLKDHLGNVRVIFEDTNGDGNIDPDTEVEEINLYSPFGLKYSTYGDQNNSEYHYGYNGKEEQQGAAAGLQDFGARFLDPSIGRFISVDALADHPNQVDKSPYAYTWNNPINLTDPDGNCPSCVGFLVGAALDVATQVVIEGKDLNEVNIGSAFVSGLAGAAGVGLVQKVGTFAKGSKALQIGGEALVDGGVNAGQQFANTGEVDLVESGMAALLGGTIRTPLKNKVESGGADSVKSLEKNARKQTNRANNAQSRVDAGKGRQSKADKQRNLADTTTRKASRAKRNLQIRAVAAGVSASSGTGRIFGAIINYFKGDEKK